MTQKEMLEKLYEARDALNAADVADAIQRTQQVSLAEEAIGAVLTFLEDQRTKKRDEFQSIIEHLAQDPVLAKELHALYIRKGDTENK